jgi:phage-related protein
MKRPVTPLVWVASSLDDLRSMPEDVIDDFGHALYDVQEGKFPRTAKALSGFGGAMVLELVESRRGNAYRAVYTVRFEGRIYVLHVFQKKSKSGQATPKPDLDLIRSRLKRAEDMHEKWRKSVASERDG